MARMVRRTRQNDAGGMGIRLPELIVMIAAVAAIVAGIRYYFFVYRVSPGYMVTEYWGAIKAGNVERQYALVSEKDKTRYYPTQKTYETQAPQSRGYTARVADVICSQEEKDARDPGIMRVKATISIRGSSSGKALYESDVTKYDDTYAMRKEGDQWKVWLGKSTMNSLKATPSPPGDSF